MEISTEEFKALIAKNGMSQTDFAKALGLNVYTVAGWIRRGQIPAKYVEKVKEITTKKNDHFSGIKKIPFFPFEELKFDFKTGFSPIGEPSIEYPNVRNLDLDFATTNRSDCLYPDISKSDMVFVKVVKERGFFKYGSPYLIVTNEYKFIRKIRKGKNDKYITLSCNTPDSDDIDLSIDQIQGLYLITMVVKHLTS